MQTYVLSIIFVLPPVWVKKGCIFFPDEREVLLHLQEHAEP